MNVLITKVLLKKFNRPCTQMLFNRSEIHLRVKSLRKVPSMTVGFLSLPPDTCRNNTYPDRL